MSRTPMCTLVKFSHNWIFSRRAIGIKLIFFLRCFFVTELSQFFDLRDPSPAPLRFFCIVITYIGGQLSKMIQILYETAIWHINFRSEKSTSELECINRVSHYSIQSFCSRKLTSYALLHRAHVYVITTYTITVLRNGFSVFICELSISAQNIIIYRRKKPQCSYDALMNFFQRF